MKGESATEVKWYVRNKRVTTSDLRLAINYGIPKTMRDYLDDHTEDYSSLTYEDWCEVLSTIEVKYERKIAAVHIKKINSARAEFLSNINKFMRITRRKKAKTLFLRYNNSPRRAHDRHYRIQRYCVLYKKAGMPEHKYASHRLIGRCIE